MSRKSEYIRISKRAHSLLKKSENKEVDYKLTVKGLSSEDIVAFANCASGGAILIGVDEGKDANGKQIGIIKGSKVGDHIKMQIISKALSCSPPIQIEIVLENSSVIPFYRIEIPSSHQKPHSTGNGTYKIREDGRNSPLLPELLLKMFLVKETEEFRERFAESTSGLEEKMSSTLDIIGELESIITSKIDDISSSMGWAEYEAGNARSTIEDVDSKINKLKNQSENNQQRVKALIKHLEVKDPIIERAKQQLYDLLIEKFENESGALESVVNGNSVSISGGLMDEMTKEEASEILTKAAKDAQDKKRPTTDDKLNEQPES